jgi:hypothetical protein
MNGFTIDASVSDAPVEKEMGLHSAPQPLSIFLVSHFFRCVLRYHEQLEGLSRRPSL